MSWQENIENIQFSIQTGDGKTYFPYWKSGEKSKDFNFTKYDFINLEGSFIDRKKAQSNQYPLVFWFQGENNIQDSDAFETSANDNRYWTINHPFYGILKGQPTNLRRNDLNYNVTEISVDFWESIIDEFPKSSISTIDEVAERVINLNSDTITFATQNATPEISDINTTRETAFLVASGFNPDNNSFNDYTRIVESAIQNVDDLLVDTQRVLTDLQEIVSFPASFDDTIERKIDSYTLAYQELKDGLGDLFSKYFFESQTVGILGGMCQTAINPSEEDYITRSDIVEINNRILAIYDDYLQTMDNNQVDIYDVNNTWYPNASVQLNLLELINLTSNRLFSISFQARQERTVELKEDSNIILLTHRYF